MTRFQIDSDAVLSAAAGVQGSIGRIQGEVAGLYSQLLNLQSSWSGAAASAFHGAVSEWKATQQRVEENLASLNSALSQSAQHYAEIEAANTRMFAR